MQELELLSKGKIKGVSLLKIQEITADNEFGQEGPGRNKRNKRNKRKKNRLFSLFKFILVIIFVMVTLVCLALSPLFYINRIEVSGNKHYNSSEVISVTNLVPGNNWFKMNKVNIKGILSFRSLEAEASILKKCPYIKSAAVRLSSPGVVKIILTERNPVGVVPYLGTNLIIDNEGYILDAGNKPAKDNLPVIKGLVFEHYSLGQMLKPSDPEGIRAFNKVMEVIESSDSNADGKYNDYKVKSHVKHIDVSDPDNIHIYLDSRITVNLGNYEDIDYYRIDFLKEIFFFKLKKADRGYLDFTTGDNPNFIPE